MKIHFPKKRSKSRADDRGAVGGAIHCAIKWENVGCGEGRGRAESGNKGFPEMHIFGPSTSTLVFWFQLLPFGFLFVFEAPLPFRRRARRIFPGENAYFRPFDFETFNFSMF
jgi:hypothetical protein